jgi:hypothetical protein
LKTLRGYASQFVLSFKRITKLFLKKSEGGGDSNPEFIETKEAVF